MDAGDHHVLSMRGAQGRGGDGRDEQSGQGAEDWKASERGRLNAHGLWQNDCGETMRLVQGVAGSQSGFTAEMRRTPRESLPRGKPLTSCRACSASSCIWLF